MVHFDSPAVTDSLGELTREGILQTMPARKDFSQVALDVVRQATGETPKQPPKPQKETAPKVTKGAAKKATPRKS